MESKRASARPASPRPRNKSQSQRIIPNSKPTPRRRPASRTQKNKNFKGSRENTLSPLVNQEFTENEPVKWNFTDPLTISKHVIKDRENVMKVKGNIMKDYINYLVELKKKIEEIPKSVFTSRSKINDIIDSIDNKLRILEQIK
jgi:uncharacterized protein YaaR (DUF327 family)